MIIKREINNRKSLNDDNLLITGPVGNEHILQNLQRKLSRTNRCFGNKFIINPASFVALN
jgi:hypothetical protein